MYVKGQVVDISGFLASRALLEPQLCPGGMEEPRVMCKHASRLCSPKTVRTGRGLDGVGEKRERPVLQLKCFLF